MLYLKALQEGDWVVVDSAEMVHGWFKMKGAVDTVRMVTLYMNEEGLMPLVLENGKIRVNISNTQLKAEGTPLNDQLYDFIARRNDMERAINDMERKEARMVLDGVRLDDIHDQLQHEVDSMVQAMDAYVKGFITTNYENVLGYSIFMMMCSTLPYPVMTPEIEEILKSAPLAFKQNPLVKDYVAKAKENMKLIEENKRLPEGVGPVRELPFHFGALNLHGAHTHSPRHHGGEQQTGQQGSPEDKSRFPGGFHDHIPFSGIRANGPVRRAPMLRPGPQAHGPTADFGA